MKKFRLSSVQLNLLAVIGSHVAVRHAKPEGTSENYKKLLSMGLIYVVPEGQETL